MGIIAIGLGVSGLLIGWVPFLGLIAIPIAAIGGFLGLIGLVIAAIKDFKGWSMPLLGCLICGVTIVVSIGSTGATSAVIGEAVEEANKKVTSKRAAEEAAETSYIANNLIVGDVKAAYRESALDGRVAGLTFTIRNNGDRTVKRIKVICRFFDASGRVVAEEIYQPVSEFDFANGQPLKPGYTWAMTNGRFYTAKGIPRTWASGRVSVVVSEIDFQ
jgi:hypothetical protein